MPTTLLSSQGVMQADFSRLAVAELVRGAFGFDHGFHPRRCGRHLTELAAP